MVVIKMADWREQLRANMGLSNKTIETLYEVLRYNPNLPLQSIYSALQQRGLKKITTKRLRKYMANDPKIGRKQDLSKFSHRPMVYYLKEEAK